MITRISQRSIYSVQVSNMNDALSRLMELNLQSSTQKKINKPSDDPVGAARVLNYKASLENIDRYQDNVKSAQGWLKQQDDTLTQVNTIVTRLKEIAEQGSTGTLSADNREAISYEARQLFQQLIGLSNAEYEGKSLFAGQKTDTAAFTETLGVTTNGFTSLPGDPPTVLGSSAKAIVVRFKNGGAISGLAAGDIEYSTDGGKTFTAAPAPVDADGAGPGSRYTVTLGGVQVTMDGASTVAAYDPANPLQRNTGSWMYVRPAAVYQGDDNDGVDVSHFGSAAVTTSATGAFPGNVMVRIDPLDPANPANPVPVEGQINYSYSVDGGTSWVSGNTLPALATPLGPDPQTRTLPIPGGMLTISGASGTSLTSNQFVVRPREADIGVDISPSEKVVINGVGKDIFGGLYDDPDPTKPLAAVTPGGDPNRNLFETVGNLVAALETNDQDACSQALENLRKSSQHILTQAASVGGRENRLTTTGKVLDSLALSQKEGLSDTEDADLTELMTDLANQQLIYQFVLKSSSNVMQVSLLNYL